MNQASPLTRFRIAGLRGRGDIDAIIRNNTLVIVGENGSGKTTFLRIMFYFLSGRFSSLIQFRFESVTAVISGKEYSVSFEEIKSTFGSYSQLDISRLPPSLRNRVREAEAQGRFEEVNYILETYNGRSASNRPLGIMAFREEDSSSKIIELQTEISGSMNAQILYLPTYRRIERELASIFSGMAPDEVRKTRSAFQQQQGDADNSYIELVEFGMADVEKAINSKLEEISKYANAGLNSLTLSYLGDVVNRNYRSINYEEIENASSDAVWAVLNRVGSAILSDENKNHLHETIFTAKSRSREPSEHEQIIFHYFTKLLRFQRSLQEQEGSISAFCGLCSSYISDKKFVYDDRNFNFNIEWSSEGGSDKRNGLKLSDLSSGEKQIVSLFSHLYLSGLNRFFVLIDEPELSLSVPWQRRFLTDIRNGEFCSGLVAVTHSPFIYDNELRQSTHALGEFLRGPDWGNLQ